MDEESLERFLEGESSVLMLYKESTQGIPDLLEIMPGEELYVLGDFFQNYTVEQLEGYAEEFNVDLHGVRKKLVTDEIESERFGDVLEEGDLAGRQQRIYEILNSSYGDQGLVYVFDDMDNAAGFRSDDVLFRYLHDMTGKFRAVEGKSIILANKGYSGRSIALADQESEL